MATPDVPAFHQQTPTFHQQRLMATPDSRPTSGSHDRDRSRSAPPSKARPAAARQAPGAEPEPEPRAATRAPGAEPEPEPRAATRAGVPAAAAAAAAPRPGRNQAAASSAGEPATRPTPALPQLRRRYLLLPVGFGAELSAAQFCRILREAQAATAAGAVIDPLQWRTPGAPGMTCGLHWHSTGFVHIDAEPSNGTCPMPRRSTGGG